ncbi:MAG: tetratricopeptide repeat protein [Labilithrix sp.]|nr:tetratricopeptide repeat protein [Labilithrix sp.]
MRLGRVACAIVVASACSLTSATARAGDPAAAREQVKLGYKLAQAGKCEEALPHFVESLRLDVKAITLINLAACEEKTGKMAEALGHWVEARSRAEIENNRPILEEAEKKLKALEPRVPRITLALTDAPPDTEIERDGVVLGPASLNVPLPVNPGAHTIVVRAKGREDTTASIAIAEGESKRVELRLGAPAKPAERAPVAPAPSAPETPSGSTSPLVYVGFGVGGAGLIAGAVTGLMAFGAASSAKTSCPSGVCEDRSQVDDANSGKTLGTVSTIAFIVGGAGVALGVYSLVWGKPTPSTSLAVSVGPTGGVVRGTF